MTELDRDLDQQSSNADLNQERLRKRLRGRRFDASAPDDMELNRHQSARRAARRSEPSIRERLAATHISIPSQTIQSLQGKLSSTIDQVARQFAVDQPSQRGFDDNPSSRNKRRRSAAQHSENPYEATSRTETQRKTSTSQPYLPRKNRRLYDSHSEAAPPVMVRGGMGGMAFGRVASSRLQKQKTPRRRFDVPLSVPGAEVRLPSIPLVHLGWKAISLIMAVMMVVSLFMMWKSPVFQVKTVQAKGLQRLTEGDLNVVLGSVGRSVFSLDPRTLKQNLQQAFPELDEISVRVNLPSSITVVAVEREPVISWTQDGRESWVDAEGVSFPPRGSPASALVRVEGYGSLPEASSVAATDSTQYLPPGMPFSATPAIPTFKLPPELINAILELGKKMPAETLLVYDSEHGLGWYDPNGWEVFFGAEDQDMEMKLAVYQALVARLQSEGIQPAMISVEYVHAPYYRMER